MVTRRYRRLFQQSVESFLLILLLSCTKGAPPASLLDSGHAPMVRPISPMASSSATPAIVAPDAGVDDIQVRAQKLFEAIQKDEPVLASQMFITREVFSMIKDLKDPNAAWDKIFKKFKIHIHVLHKKLGKRAADAEFEQLELNVSKQALVAPKKESNKISYEKITQSKLRYKIRGKSRSFTIATMIQHESKWYVTQLGK